MKKINKCCPAFYSEKLGKEKPFTWAEVSGKTEIRQYMLDNEQHQQCAYTEISITANNSHIDHFVKQSILTQRAFRPLDVFSWDNLFTACNNENYGAKYKDKTIQAVDYDWLINPAIDNPSDYLEFALTGEILAKNDNLKGKRTIELFNLNHPSLVERRKSLAFQLKDYNNQFSIEEIKDVFKEFDSMIEALCNQR